MQKYIFALETKGNAALIDLFIKEDEQATNEATRQRTQSAFLIANLPFEVR